MFFKRSGNAFLNGDVTKWQLLKMSHTGNCKPMPSWINKTSYLFCFFTRVKDLPRTSFHDVANIVNEPVHGISNNVVCATSKASDQPAHTRSLVRAFASRLSII